MKSIEFPPQRHFTAETQQGCVVDMQLNKIEFGELAWRHNVLSQHLPIIN